MGNLFRAKGEFKKASFWYRRGLRADPKYGDAYIYLGVVAFDSGLLNQAEKFSRKAIDCSAESIDEAYFNLGSVFVAKRRYQEAIKCYRKAIKIDPKYTIAKKRLKDALLVLQLKKSCAKCKPSFPEPRRFSKRCLTFRNSAAKLFS